MSYHDYWDGDCEMVRYYRQAEQYRQEQASERAWLHGFYVYAALLDASPLLNPLSKRKKPLPYLKAPIPVTETAKQRAQADENRRKLAAGRNAMQALAQGLNAKFRKGGNDGGG